MSLIDNTFENQSTLEDENKGGALAEATGGSEGNTGGLTGSSLSSKFSLDAAKSFISDALSKIPGGKLFQDGKFVFPSNLLSKFKLDSLLDTIKNAMGTGMSLFDSLKNGINGLLSKFLSVLKLDAGDSWAFLQSAYGTFKDTLNDKIKGLLLSRVYVPDIVFLAGLYPIAATGSNIKYKNEYVRNLCIKHDMPLSMAFVDKLQGIRYTFENTKGRTDAIKAARFGSYNVSFYIMDKLMEEIKELEDCYPLPKNYDRNTQLTIRTNYTNIIREAQNKIDGMLEAVKGDSAATEAVKKTPFYISTKKTLDEYTQLKESLFINKEDKYREDPQYLKIRTYIFNSRKMIAQIMKYVIVYSYSNLTPLIISVALKRYDIDPQVFGTTDTEYGKTACFSSNDINIMAPIFTPSVNKTGNDKSLLAEVSQVSKKSSLVPDVNPKFISPRNVNIKAIYIQLASKNINKKYMTNKPFYERLKYPVYSTAIAAADNALSGLLDVGIGKSIVNTLTSIEEAFYQYGKALEPYLYNASKIQYISYNDLSPLPEPDSSETANNSTNRKGTTSSGRKDATGNNKASKPASGTKIDTKIDPYSDILAYMSEEEITNLLIKYFTGPGLLTLDEINNMSLGAKKDYLIKNLKEKKVSTSDIINDLSVESLRKFWAAKTGQDTSKMSLDELKKASSEYMSFREIDYDKSPDQFINEEDMIKYLRKYYSYKEMEMRKWSVAKLKRTFKNKLVSDQNRRIFYTKSYNIVGYDVYGFPILGYPSSDIVQAAINSGEIGTFSKYNPNGYPVSENGYACPIIGYDPFGNAVYGAPVFYPDTNPISADFRGMPVFAYYKDKSILDDMNKTESQIESIIISNTAKIATLNKYIENGASGLLLSTYKRQIKSLTELNKEYENVLSMIMIKPLIAYDEYGNKVFGEIDVSYNVLTPDNKYCIGYDYDGRPVYEYTEEGRTVIGYRNDTYIYGSALCAPLGTDAIGKIIYGFDTKNKPIYGFTENGTPVNEIVYDSNNKIIGYVKSTGKKRDIIGKSASGEFIYEYDTFGNPIISFDLDGKPVIYVDNEKLAINKANYEDKKSKAEEKTLEIYKVYAKFKGYSTDITNLPSSEIIDAMLKDSELSNILSVSEITNFNIYYEKYTDYKEKCDIYNRIETEKPTPPIIGFDNERVPILGKALIVSKIKNDVPELIINDDIYTIPNSVYEASEKASVLNKTDLDIDKDFESAEQELILTINGDANIGQLLTLVYGLANEIVVEPSESSEENV